jgi:hypothetical protein
MFGFFYYITKKGTECVVETSGGCFFTPNEFEKEKYLKRDLEIFDSLKEKITFDVSDVISRLEKSDVIVFSDLDNMKFTTYSGSELDAFKNVLINYKLIDKDIKKYSENLYTKRCSKLSELFGNSYKISLDDESNPKYWIIKFDTCIKEVNTLSNLDELSSFLSELKEKLQLLEEKPFKWNFKNNKIICYYEIKCPIIEFFKSKKKYENESHTMYKFGNYLANTSSLHIKVDGSLYVEVQQLHTRSIPKIEGRCTTYNFENATEEVYEEFKKHMFDEYNCELASKNNHRLFFDVV